MKEVAKNDKKIKKVINEKLDTMFDLVKNKANSDLIFVDEEIFSNFVNLLKEIYDLYDTIVNYTDDFLQIHGSLMDIEDLVEINIKYYGKSVD